MKLETRNEKHKIGRREQIILYAPLVLWIGAIFFLSSGQGSMTRTSLIVRPILEFLFPTATEETLLFYHGFVRKFAHFAEYAVLGFLACRAFAGSAQNFVSKHFYIFAIVLVLLVAVLDELNQSFNPARTGSPVDVVIDLSGGLLAIALYYFVARRQRHPSAT